MPDNLPVLSSGLFPARYERKLARATSRQVALVRAREDIAAVKIEAVETVGCIALSSVASLSMIELALAQRDPHAAERLTFIADSATYAIKRQIDHFERSLR